MSDHEPSTQGSAGAGDTELDRTAADPSSQDQGDTDANDPA